MPRPPVPVDPPVAIVPPLPGDPPVPVVTLATHALFAQCSVDAHTIPQPPQLPPLVVVSAQLVPHSVCPGEQSMVQMSLLQNWAGGQVCEQLPQCVASEATQEPLHSMSPDWQWHE